MYVFNETFLLILLNFTLIFSLFYNLRFICDNRTKQQASIKMSVQPKCHSLTWQDLSGPGLLVLKGHDLQKGQTLINHFQPLGMSSMPQQIQRQVLYVYFVNVSKKQFLQYVVNQIISISDSELLMVLRECQCDFMFVVLSEREHFVVLYGTEHNTSHVRGKYNCLWLSFETGSQMS